MSFSCNKYITLLIKILSKPFSFYVNVTSLKEKIVENIKNIQKLTKIFIDMNFFFSKLVSKHNPT